MNPSAPGWIDKYAHLVKNNMEVYDDFRKLYNGLKKTGFVYGLNIKIPRFIEAEHVLSEDEKAKINLLTAHFFTFKIERQTADFETFIAALFSFYKELNISVLANYSKLPANKLNAANLERLIDSRIYLQDNVISKTFNSVITNSLLFIDVLTFKEYLSGHLNTRLHAQNLEHITINLTYHALSSKEKNRSDDRLIHLFENSLTFIEQQKDTFDGTYRDQLSHFSSLWEKRYFLDVACLTVWEDNLLEYQESEFIFGIGQDLGFDEKQISRALEEITSFFEQNSEQIPFLKDSNLAIQFYDSMSKLVNKLILRNRKRLQKELEDSKELVALLSKSTVKDLSAEEKKKMQTQLIDIFKSIPSLAIFMLPGGAVLLPIFIKLVPQLLPSAFDDNRIE